MKFFIVDDDEMNRTLIAARLASMFSNEEVKIIQAVNGLEARDKLAELADSSATLPDIIFSDYQMSGLNGLELMHFIKGHPLLKEAPFILLTAILNPQCLEAEIAIQHKAWFVSKPFRAAEFKRLIVEILS